MKGGRGKSWGCYTPKPPELSALVHHLGLARFREAAIIAYGAATLLHD